MKTPRSFGMARRDARYVCEFKKVKMHSNLFKNWDITKLINFSVNEEHVDMFIC